jgi:hypothetical protein
VTAQDAWEQFGVRVRYYRQGRNTGLRYFVAAYCPSTFSRAQSAAWVAAEKLGTETITQVWRVVLARLQPATENTR